MSSKNYVCLECPMMFETDCELRSHLSSLHAKNGGPSVKSPVTCPRCCKTVSNKYALKRHLETHQKNKFYCPSCASPFSTVYRLKYHSQQGCKGKKPDKKCPICQNNFTSRTIHDHFKSAHNLDICPETHLFANFSDFEIWKDNVEVDTFARFVISHKTSGNVYYSCHRSGCYDSKGTGVRQLKMKGSNKINAFCPARMNVRVLEDGKVSVDYIQTHLGHNLDSEHLTLSKNEKLYLASKISSKESFDAILEEIRSSVTENQRRIDLLTRKDLYNVEKQFHLNNLRGKKSQTNQKESLFLDEFIILNPSGSSRNAETLEERKVKKIEEFKSLISNITTIEDMDAVDEYLNIEGFKALLNTLKENALNQEIEK